MFTDYQSLPTENLVDLLAQETQKLTQLLSEKDDSAAYDECKNTIQNIQAIILGRQEQSVSDPGIQFTIPDTSQ